MKTLISVDMEGISGIVSRQETLPRSPSWPDGVKERYRQCRHWMVWDTNAAIEGALSGGATEVVVTDPHHQLNLPWDELHPKAELVRRDLIACTPDNILQGLDENFDTVLFVGQHTRYGHSRGLLSHTLTRPFSHVRVNGELADEVKLATARSGELGVPVALVTGDDAICHETQQWLPQVETAVVKYAIDTYSAVCLSKDEAHQRIRQAAKRAVEKTPQLRPFTFRKPVRLEVDLLNPTAAVRLTLLPGVKRTADLTVAYESHDYDLVWRILRAMVLMAMTTRDPIPW